MEITHVKKCILEFVKNSPLNSVEEMGIRKIYDAPIVGFASAQDPLFKKLKAPNVVGYHHMMPQEWMPEAQTVISYFLPFSKHIRHRNAKPGLPAVEWVYGRIEGEQLNDALRKFIVRTLEEKGGKALAPVHDPRFEVVDKRSNWSERHVAFIAGLGTFGLSKSLITKKGCAGRYGSVITSLKMKPTPRNYTQVYEYCNMCGDCITRCPSKAIQKEGKDTGVCSQYLDNEIKPRFAPRYGCGKCQTAVSCECAIP